MENFMVFENIKRLTQYGIQTGLISEYDRTYVINSLVELFQLDRYEDQVLSGETMELEQILHGLLDYAVEQNIIKEDSIVNRDLFDTKIMGLLVPRPSEVIGQFQSLYEESPKKATDYFYKLSQDTDYIRRYRIKKDIKWVTETKYGTLDITINLSKPEKDPRDIAAAKLAKQVGYPKCQLCKENEGYAGRVDHPARQNHRIIPITINQSQWGFQYSPYVYYNEHCIVFNYEHVPMKIDRDAFRKLFDFVKLFPHYIVGSNADLPIVGGSILSHDHFQGGNYEFPMARAEIEQYFIVKDFEEIEVGIVNWPMSVIRTRCKDEARLVELGSHILKSWREYNDEDSFIFAYTDGEPHSTITPIARKSGEYYELDLVLRNNITTKEHPLGVFHPHSELHHIKKENIGLIEVMGLAILPARLVEEINLIKEYILENKNPKEHKGIEKHAEWMETIKDKYAEIDAININDILQKEIGYKFESVLEHAGVFKGDQSGRQAFAAFINQL